MPIHSISNNNVSFGHIKKTKKGNEYVKTHAATRTGMAIGLVGAGAAIYSLKSVLKSPDMKRMIGEWLVGIRNHLISVAPSFSKAKAGKAAKVLFKAGVAAPVVGIFLTNLIIGASVNKIINHHRAKAADKSVDALNDKLNGK